MKYIIIVLLAFSIESFSQFKNVSQPSISDSFIHSPTSEWFGFFNPDNFSMHHSYSMSFATMGGQNLTLGKYTNNMMYKISDKLDAQVAISLQHSPYNNFDKRLQNSLNGIFLDKAQLNYRPSENTLLQLSFQQVPWNYYYNDYFWR